MKKLVVCAMAVVLPLFSGCSILSVGESEFACEKDDSCQSIREVYETRYDNPEQIDGVEEVSPSEPEESFLVDYRDGPEWLGANSTVLVDGKEVVKREIVTNDQPLRVNHGFVREESALLSTYIMPYTDGGDTANLGHEMVTEVVPRKWKVAEVKTRNRAGIVPNKVKSRQANKG